MSARKTKRYITDTLQFRLALGYSLIIVVLLVLINTYPLVNIQAQMFRSEQAELQKQVMQITNLFATADSLSTETVEQALNRMDGADQRHIVVTNETGRIVFDNRESFAEGSYALNGVMISALKGNDAFWCRYSEEAFRSQAASPVTAWGNIVGAVCLYDEDEEQGLLFRDIQNRLMVVSLIVSLCVLALFTVFSLLLSRRVSRLLAGIRFVQEGDYSYRIPEKGRDELGQIATGLNQLAHRLQLNEETRRRFVSDASHELKTPLASIRLLTDSILDDESIDPHTTREFVGDIGDAADRLIHISEELLTLNRLDEGGPPAQRVPVNVNKQALQIKRMLNPLAMQADVTLESDFGKDCVVLSTPEAVSQIIRNLMENAIKYNLPGGTVLIRTARQQDFVSLIVSDTGMGIPKEKLGQVFDRFYRVDKARSRKAGGNGLGLAIVKDTVTAHGGEITVVQNKGRGVSFIVTLPAYREKAS